MFPLTGTPAPGASIAAGDITRFKTADIQTVALEINGTTTGSTNVHVAEVMHLVPLNSEICAQFGVTWTYKGLTSTGASITCRHNGTLYILQVENTGGTNPTAIGPVDAAL